MLQKYLDISALSLPNRMEVLQKVSAKEKSNLWGVHLALHLAKQPGLNSRQMEIILEVITFATPEVYEIPRNSSEWVVKVNGLVQLLTSRALEVFSRDEIVKIFSNLGGKNLSLRDNIANYDDNGLEVPICDCSRQWADCPGFKLCGGLCIVPPGGGDCGFMGLYNCDGQCQ